MNDEMDREIETLIERFRSGDLQDVKEHSKEECAALVDAAVKFAEGEITAKITKGGSHLITGMHVKGNPAAMLVAAYCIVDGFVEKSPGITFDDTIMMLRCMEEKAHGSEGPEDDHA